MAFTDFPVASRDITKAHTEPNILLFPHSPSTFNYSDTRDGHVRFTILISDSRLLILLFEIRIFVFKNVFDTFKIVFSFLKSYFRF